jgi:glycerol-3-phosphate dehydrogenase
MTTRGFICIDHATQGLPGFFSVVGGKTTTARLMAENLGDLVCTYLGINVPCTTREMILASHHQWITS